MDRQAPRQACERCHRLKLRCDRSDTAKDCRRCLSARATCVFQPSARQSTPSTRHPRKKPIPHNSTEDVSNSDSPSPSPVSDPELNADTCTKEISPSSPCQPSQHLSDDLDSSLSSLNSSALPLDSLTELTFPDCYSAEQTLGNNDSTGMDFLMNLPSPQFADSTGMVVPPISRPDFQVQFMKDLLEVDVELIQLTFALVNSSENGFLQAIADRVLMVAQQMLKVFHSAECWVSQANYPQAWCPYLCPPSTSGGLELLETSLDQASTIHALSTYLRLVKAYQMLFTLAISNYTAAVQPGPWDPFPSVYTQDFTTDVFAMQPVLSTQSTVPLLERLSYMVQLLTLPFMEVDIIKTAMAAVGEHEGQMMQSVAQLRQVEYDRL